MVNDVGDSDPSIVNTSGDAIEQVPHIPPVAPTKNVATTKLQLVVDYMQFYGSSDGGAEILNYEL